MSRITRLLQSTEDAEADVSQAVRTRADARREFGAALRCRRQELGISARALALAAGVDVSNLSKLERGLLWSSIIAGSAVVALDDLSETEAPHD